MPPDAVAASSAPKTASPGLVPFWCASNANGTAPSKASPAAMPIALRA
jgi:hypothetical protein